LEYLASHPPETKIFSAAMADVTRNVARAAIAANDFSHYRVTRDVGGGNGASLAEVLRHEPSASGIPFDVAAGLTKAQETLLRAGVAIRCTAISSSLSRLAPIQ